MCLGAGAEDRGEVRFAEVDVDYPRRLNKSIGLCVYIIVMFLCIKYCLCDFTCVCMCVACVITVVLKLVSIKFWDIPNLIK